MSSSAWRAASKMATVPGLVSFLTQIFAKCSQAVEALKTPSAQTASAVKENVTTQVLFVLSKVILL
jgi:hypothetical protein